MAIDIEELLNIMQMQKKATALSPITSVITSKPQSVNQKVEEFKPDFELDDDGEEYMPVGTQGLLAASEKLLAINKGLVEPDERDSMQFQKIIRPAGMFRERIKMDSGKLARQAMYQASRRRNLSGLTPGFFSPYIDSVIKGNPLTSPLEEINPMQLVENARRITKMGPGGIPSADSITVEAQSVNPSQFGYICTISGPESERAGIDVRAAHGTKIGANGRIYQKMFNRRTKKYVWVSPQDIAGKNIKLPD